MCYLNRKTLLKTCVTSTSSFSVVKMGRRGILEYVALIICGGGQRPNVIPLSVFSICGENMCWPESEPCLNQMDDGNYTTEEEVQKAKEILMQCATIIGVPNADFSTITMGKFMYCYSCHCPGIPVASITSEQNM